MQVSLRIIFLATTLVASDCGLGVFLLEQRLLSGSLIACSNFGLLISLFILQLAAIALLVTNSNKSFVRRFLIAGGFFWLAMFVLSRVYADALSRWLGKHSSWYSTTWAHPEFLLSLAAMAAIPFFLCVVSLSAATGNRVFTTVRPQLLLFGRLLKQLLLRIFSTRGLFVATLCVAAIMWWQTPSFEEQRAEQRLVGKWEIRLEEFRTQSTETRVVVCPSSERYGISNSFDSSKF